MRLTVAHLREAAIIGCVGLIAFAAMRMAYLSGNDSPFMPGAVSLFLVALWIFLLRRYGPRPQRPVDPRRQQIWFLSSLAASGALAVFGMIAFLWIRGTYAEPSAPCPPRSSTNAAPPNDDVSTNRHALSPAAEEKIAGAAAHCDQPS
jgi:hypothetical protein